MANEALAPVPATPPSAPSEDEYQTFCAALSASGRGRAFLAEYANRNRGADTEVLLAALTRLEGLIRLQRAGAEPARGELRALLSTIRAARPEIAASTVPVRAAKLAQLLELLERRLEALSEPEPPSTDVRLAVVPPSEEPELPIPSPSATQPALTLAIDRDPPSAKRPVPGIAAAIIVPEVTWLDGPPPDANDLVDAGHRDSAAPSSMAEKAAALSSQPQAEPAAPAPPPEPLVQWSQATAAPADPLAPLNLLSEVERLALFT